MNLAQPPQIPLHQSEHPKQTPSLPTQTPPLDKPSPPLQWLWPQRIPMGKLTLLDASPGCGTSLFSLTLAACVSSGTPFPDGTPCIPGPVILIAPHDNFSDTIKPRLQAAGGNSYYVIPLHTVADPTPNSPRHSRPFSLPQDLDHLETTIVTMGVRLVIIDPFTAVPGLARSLLALIHLAERTNCAILLTRTLNRPPADPLRPHCPASPVLTAARSHLLLAPDPAAENKNLLLTPKHPLCSPPPILSYQITATPQDIPTIHWLGEREPTRLRRLCTGPIRSLHRQAILRFLHDSPAPCSIKEILAATSYDYEPGRRMFVRMHMAGELISPARGLYTTPDHPCLAHFPKDPLPNPPTFPLPITKNPVAPVPIPANTDTNAQISNAPVAIVPIPHAPAAPVPIPAGTHTYTQNTNDPVTTVPNQNNSPPFPLPITNDPVEPIPIQNIPQTKDPVATVPNPTAIQSQNSPPLNHPLQKPT